MKRIVLPVLFLLMTSQQAWAVETGSVLTGKTLIDAEVVTVGDLFTKAGTHANHVLAPAPKAGGKLVLGRTDLMRVSDAFHLNWTPADVIITLESNKTLISEQAITKALSASELKDKIDSDAEFNVTNLQEDVIVSGKMTPELVVRNTGFNPETDKFTAVLDIKSGDALLKTVSLEGVATAMVKVPAVKYIMTANSTVTANDITEVSVPKKSLRGAVVSTKDELIGMTVRRALQPNMMISQDDVAPPLMIKRNEIVNVIYRSGVIELSTKARALNSAGRGEVVQLVNPTSKKSFEAKVTGPQQAEVNLEG